MLACELEMRRSSVWIVTLLAASLAPFAPAQAPENKEAQAAEFKGLPPRASPSEYQAQGKAGAVTIAAEFAGHSVPKLEGPLNTEDFVVVETAFFGAPGAKLVLSTNDFSLRINGKKKGVLPSVPFGMVTSSLKDPEWQPPEQKDAEKPSKSGLSTGQGGDNTPPVIHVPLELRRAMAQYLEKASLPEGDRTLPQAGLIYFRYSGHTKNIHSLELIYSGPAGEATLDLQP
jgi:hypothetical protein